MLGAANELQEILVEACQEDSSGHVQEVMTVLRDGDIRWEEPMHPIEVKQVKEIILVSDVTCTRAVVCIARHWGLPCPPPRIG